MNTQRRAACGGSFRRIAMSLAIVAMVGIGFLVGYALGQHQPGTITTSGGNTIEFRYDEQTGWFEVWENGILRSEFTATELHIEHLADPHGWQP